MEVARGNGNVHWTSHMMMIMMMISCTLLTGKGTLYYGTVALSILKVKYTGVAVVSTSALTI